jgi:hypothetical protein
MTYTTNIITRYTDRNKNIIVTQFTLTLAETINLKHHEIDRKYNFKIWQNREYDFEIWQNREYNFEIWQNRKYNFYIYWCEQKIQLWSVPTKWKYESVKITNKIEPCNRIYYSKIYWRLNMFRAAHRSSSGAPNCFCSLWFIYCI